VVPPRPLPAGEGWIPDDAAQIGIQAALGYANPDAASPLLLDIGDDWVTDMGWTGAIRGCSGDWLLVDYQIERARTPTFPKRRDREELHGPAASAPTRRPPAIWHP
jgi:hypothetical protein